MLSVTSRNIFVRGARRRLPAILTSFSPNVSSSPTTSFHVPRFAKASSSSSFAVVHHADEFEDAIAGMHGKQLQLANQEGEGKDDAPYDPFLLDDDDDDDDLTYDDGEEEPLQDGEDDDTEWEEEEEEDDGDRQVLYNNDGSLIRPKSELAALQAGLPAGGLFAIINLNGSQQKVSVDDLVIVNKLLPLTTWAVGTTHTLTEKDVLMLGSSHFTLVGMPGIAGAQVDVTVEEITRDKTVIIFKKRRRKHSKRKNGFRREVTFLRVSDIRLPEQCQQLDYQGK